ncbi:MAG TPA: hypothetical protein VN732_09500 [Solirubrobacterales bacterium]|nr:hypothetical protein [Solirubrobacterales bacterium]
MSLDLGGPAIEIAIALAFVFFLLSLIVSHVAELIAGAAKLRAKNLKKSLEGVLGDKGLAQSLFDHPLVRTDLGQSRKRGPSYISPKNFALALRDLARTDPDAVHGASDDLSEQLRALSGAPATLPDVPELEKWFDESMDRASGWYKRKAQWIALGIAAVVVLLLNVSTLRIAEQLSAEPKVLANVVAKAEAAADRDEVSGEGQSEGDEDGTAGMKQAGMEAEEAVGELAALSLPVFWTEEKNRPSSAEEWWVAIGGWLITILAVSLGAPFWFDALNKLSNLRMAGKKPEEKPKAET